MNDGELKHKVNQVLYDLLISTGVVVSVDVLQKVGVLSKENYEKWRNGKVHDDCMNGVVCDSLQKFDTFG